MSGAERGSLLEWRWTPFFALLTLALVTSLVTALAVPSTPAQFFATPEMTRALGKRSGIPTQSGMGSTLSLDGADGSNDEPASVGGGATSRRGSLQRLAERNRPLSTPPTPAPRQFSEPIRREIPPPPEPELSNERVQQEEAPGQDQAADDAEEDEPELPQPVGSGGAGPEGEGEADEEGPPAPAERPKLVNPGVLRAIPGLQR